jgi:hypothetical protein
VKKFVSFLEPIILSSCLYSTSEFRGIFNSPKEGLARRRNKKGKESVTNL